MAKKTGSREKLSPLSIRIPVILKEELTEVADARCIDLTSLVLQVIAEARPKLRHWLRQYRKNLEGKQEEVICG